ncbi:MAG: DUF362 domain-containing protein [Candidatus Marinimicrobia bacterium]|nr:DUF362 domain-containing protein [Candidatus Neomarinimicrobiota bacterium]
MMTKSKLFLYRFTTKNDILKTQKNIKLLFVKAGFASLVGKHELTAVKTHFGERGVSSFVAPEYIEPIIRKIKACGAKPFLSDTNVLYKSERDNAVDHLNLAYEHGFTPENTGAPVIIADGINGINEQEIEINAPLNRKVCIAREYLSANSIIVVTHATGHLATGVGATIKNLGMGMSSRKGKLVQHSVSHPYISETKCIKCGTCLKWCPADAIILQERSAFIIDEKCIGCGECLAVCRPDAVKFKWNSGSTLLQQQIVEHALGIVKEKKGKMGYFTFMINMTKDCDCIAQPAKFILEDIGVIAGTDPVAIDQAVWDLTRHEGKNISQHAYPNIDGEEQLRYGEKVGLGSRNYEIEEI